MKNTKYYLAALFVVIACRCTNNQIRLLPAIDFGESATTLLKTENNQLVSDDDLSKSSNRESIGYLLEMRTISYSNENCDTTKYQFIRNNLFCVSMKYNNMPVQDLRTRLEKIKGVEKHSDYYLLGNNIIFLSAQSSCNGAYLLYFNNVDKEISKLIASMKQPSWIRTQEECDQYVEQMTRFNDCDVVSGSWLMYLLGSDVRGNTYYQKMLSL